MPLLHRFSCSTRTGATGGSIVVGSTAFDGLAAAGIGSAGDGAPWSAIVFGTAVFGTAVFGTAVFGSVAVLVHPARTATKQPTTAAHPARLRRSVMVRPHR